MNRPMFMDVENVGIMQGFKDDEYEDMDEGYESAAMIDRTPSSPEILMNNLRGDMRSVDARMEELAQLVGEEAAMETPAEVLALLQPVLAEQEGIGSLPAGMPTPPMGSSPMMPPSPMEAGQPAPDMGAMMPPDAGMMPPQAGAMPPGPPPTAQEPLQMADGGLVQRFRDGSDEEGVTPVTEQRPPRPGTAQALLAELAATRDPDALSRNFEQLLPMYQEALGGSDRSMTQSQILFDIAQAGLNLAAGTDSRGQPVRPGASFASSLASAAQGLPERIAERTGQMAQQEQGVRLAALKGAQDEASSQRALEQGIITDFARSDREMEQQLQLANMQYGRQVKLAEMKADLDLRNAMVEAQMTPEDTTLKSNWQYQSIVDYAPSYADGTGTPRQDRLFELAAAKLAQPEIVQYKNDKGRMVTEISPGLRPQSMIEALEKRGTLDAVLGGIESTKSDADSDGDIRTATPAPAGQTATSETESSTLPPRVANSIKSSEGNVSKMPKEDQNYVQEVVAPKLDAMSLPEGPRDSLWAAHKDAVGMFRQMGLIFGEYVPFDFAGRMSARVKQANEDIEKVSQQFTNAFRNTDKLSNDERREIKRFLKLEPRFFQNEAGYRNNMISLTTTLDQMQREFSRLSQDPNTTLKMANENADKAAEISKLQRLLGAPPIIRTEADVEMMTRMPTGAEVLLWDPERRIYVLEKIREE